MSFIGGIPGCGRMSQDVKSLGDPNLINIFNPRGDFSSFQQPTGSCSVNTRNLPKSNAENISFAEALVSVSNDESFENSSVRQNVQEIIDTWRSSLQFSKPVCPECGRVCSNLGNLKQHIRNMHGPPDQWETCYVCQKQCKSRQYLLQHLLQTHGIRQRSRFMRKF